jgi:MFS family permease
MRSPADIGATVPGAAAHPPSERSRWLALYTLCAGMLMIVLDVTIVNVALPSIQQDLHFSSSSLAWVVNAYLISFGGLLLLAGRLGDLIGRRRVFLTGIALFTSASLLCGFAQSDAWLVALDLFRQHPDRHRHRACRPAPRGR